MRKQTSIIIILFFITCAALAVYGLWLDTKAAKQGPYIVNGYTPSQGSISERKATKVYIRTEKRYFYPGDILTSKENGALILWDSLTMSKDRIVGIASDSGTIEHYQP